MSDRSTTPETERAKRDREALKESVQSEAELAQALRVRQESLEITSRHLLAERTRSRGLEEERNHWIRLFNRLDAAVSRHRHAAEGEGERLWVNEWDEALWAAHDRVLKSSSVSPLDRD